MKALERIDILLLLATTLQENELTKTRNRYSATARPVTVHGVNATRPHARTPAHSARDPTDDLPRIIPALNIAALEQEELAIRGAYSTIQRLPLDQV